jgi:hypothetical protein
MAWDVVYYRPRDGSIPGVEFLDNCPTKVAAHLLAVLDAVAESPPPQYSGGGKWEVMHGSMAGYYEVRATGPGREQFRLQTVSGLAFRQRHREFSSEPTAAIALFNQRRRRSVRRVETLKHGEVLHVRREELSIENERSRRDQVVDVLDPAVTRSVAPSQLTTDAGNLSIHRYPVECCQEALHVIELVLSRAGEQLEADELARDDLIGRVGETPQ